MPGKPRNKKKRIIEKSKNIISKPLSLKRQEDRIKMIMGLSSDDTLPDVDEDSLLIYYKYLVKKLTFPFDAEYSIETASGVSSSSVEVRGLLEPDECDEFYGLMCECRMSRKTVEVPLAELELPNRNPNCQMISDYASWFWDYR